MSSQILLALLLVVMLFSVVYLLRLNGASATHVSRPILLTNKTTYDMSEPISLRGWVEYFGRPISDVLLDVILRAQDGSMIAREETKSDPDGNFAINLPLPSDTMPGNYTALIISQCRKEHHDICANRDATAPIFLTKNVRSPDTTISTSSPKKFFDTRQPSPLTPNSYHFGVKNMSCNKPVHLEGNNFIVIQDRENIHICAGNDVIIDNDHDNNTIYGGIGNDVIIGFSNDTLVIDGQEGNDTIIDVGSSSAGNTIYGGIGNDVIIDNNDGNTTIYGGIGSDVMKANEGNNEIYGGYGSDTIFGVTGNNTMHGDEGYDMIYGAYGKGGQPEGIIDGGPGFDLCVNARITHNCEEQK